MLYDSRNRHLTYLRISLTDLCNLRCRYCMPEDGVHKLNHQEILTYEEIMRVVRAAAGEGMTKIRLTGGEPLIRKGILGFISELNQVPGVKDLCLTTNGVLLEDMASELLHAGIRRVNISLDSLDEENFSRITGRNYFRKVWSGLTRALATEFELIKVNCVVIRDLNDHEVVELARLSIDHPLEVRFIEFMPLGRLNFWSPERLVSADEIKERLEGLGKLTPITSEISSGPAKVFKWSGAKGTIGFISPITDHFCKNCNRLRLTADGKLRLCLLANHEIDLKKPLRAGADLEELAELIRLAVKMKPKGHILDQDLMVGSEKSMNLIGG